MRKTNNWENTAAYGDFEPLALGGHVCKICKVEETASRSGRDMVNIWLDIAEGDQKDYYSNQWKNDASADKRWGCIVYQLTEDAEGNTSRGFKTFLEAVKKSNPGFDENRLWEASGSDYLAGKLVGGVFGREQYLNRSGQPRLSTKCQRFVAVEAARKGIEPPEDKLLGSSKTTAAGNFVEVGDVDLPF